MHTNPVAAQDLLQKAEDALEGTIHIISGKMEGILHGYAVEALHGVSTVATFAGVGGWTCQIATMEGGVIANALELPLGFWALLKARKIQQQSIQHIVKGILASRNVARETAYRQPIFYAASGNFQKVAAILCECLGDDTPIRGNHAFSSAQFVEQLRWMIDKPEQFIDHPSPRQSRIFVNAVALYELIKAMKPETIVFSEARTADGAAVAVWRGRGHSKILSHSLS